MGTSQPGEAREVRFRGLDSLRFLAAFFVVIGHIPMNQASAGLPSLHWGAAFFRGAPAVSFFFSLSGFLITYLLLEEQRRSGTIRVGHFYLRRVFRIWPLYFLIVAFGLTFYNVLLPQLGIRYPVTYSLPTALLLYTLMLPNVMNSLYTVGGILNPLWSIGVEEQFYLAWGPVVKRWGRVLAGVCWLVLAVSLALFCLQERDFFGEHAVKLLVGQLKFHFMAAGALAALWLRRRQDQGRPPRFGGPARLVLFGLLLEFYLLRRIPWSWFGTEVLQLLLYPWLILAVAARPGLLENRVFNHLGKISYGIYMYHMVAVYMTSALFAATDWWRRSTVLYLVSYYALALAVTILISHLSYRWFELPFLRYKDRRFSLPPVPVPRNAAVDPA